MSRETVARLTAAMDANKIKYNKEFATALQRGFPDEARAALFEEITGDMDTIITNEPTTVINDASIASTSPEREVFTVSIS